MLKLILTVAGGLIGAMVGFAARPSHWGQRPTIGDMMTIPEFQGELLIYAGAGAAVGLLLGFAADKFGSKKDGD